VVNRVLQLATVTTTPRGDGLSGDVSQNIAIRCSIGWPCVPADHLGPLEDLHDNLEFHPPWMRDSLDPILGTGGDAQVSRQSLKSASGDRSFCPEGLNLLGILVQLLTLCVTQRRVLPIIFVSIIDVMVLLLLLLSRCALSGAGLPCTTSSILKGSSS
jgi:hypothetical protein